eukprot:CAMPEP_0170362086 /NCGR_PEP_ID=MMETSP0117_2-20130122/4146_1 /TAXON_ID=400756 /ORGANISM="Durinskia baltica, Strain CSIRO CS-38" /LENGTH=304 /DNA_ID=CAMNT_0010616483 /DNA_START=211 /DNA_END=1125 /DNA_ORIENTATION=+
MSWDLGCTLKKPRHGCLSSTQHAADAASKLPPHVLATHGHDARWLAADAEHAKSSWRRTTTSMNVVAAAGAVVAAAMEGEHVARQASVTPGGFCIGHRPHRGRGGAAVIRGRALCHWLRGVTSEGRAGNELGEPGHTRALSPWNLSLSGGAPSATPGVANIGTWWRQRWCAAWNRHRRRCGRRSLVAATPRRSVQTSAQLRPPVRAKPSMCLRLQLLVHARRRPACTGEHLEQVLVQVHLRDGHVQGIRLLAEWIVEGVRDHVDEPQDERPEKREDERTDPPRGKVRDHERHEQELDKEDNERG